MDIENQPNQTMDTEMQEDSILISPTDVTEVESNKVIPKTICERCPPHIHIPMKVSKNRAMQLWELFLKKKQIVPPTLESQFNAFATMIDSRRNGESLNLFRSDYWFRQAKILDDKTVTMIDTSSIFNFYLDKQTPPVETAKTPDRKSRKSKNVPIIVSPPKELSYEEWLRYVEELCGKKGLDVNLTKEMLRKCGLPNKEPWVDPVQEVKSDVSIISAGPEKCKCICEKHSAEADPYLHLTRPSIVIYQDD